MSDDLTVAEAQTLDRLIAGRIIAAESVLRFTPSHARALIDAEVKALRSIQDKLRLPKLSYDCDACLGRKLDLGGWMGPTPQAPYPRRCPKCSSTISQRELQDAYARYLHSAPDAIAKRGLDALDGRNDHEYPLAGGPPTDSSDLPF